MIKKCRHITTNEYKMPRILYSTSFRAKQRGKQRDKSFLNLRIYGLFAQPEYYLENPGVRRPILF